MAEGWVDENLTVTPNVANILAENAVRAAVLVGIRGEDNDIQRS